MEKEKLSQVLGFDVEKYLAYHAEFYDQKPELDKSTETQKAMQYWHEYERFLQSQPDRESAILPDDLRNKVNEATKIITLKTRDNDRLRLRSEGAREASKSDFERIRNEIVEFCEVEKSVLVRNIEAGFSDALTILNERLATCLNEIDLGLFRRKGLFHPIERQSRKAAFQSLKEILLVRWIVDELAKIEGSKTVSTAGKTELSPITWTGGSQKQIYLLYIELQEAGFIDATDRDIAKWVIDHFGLNTQVQTVCEEISRLRKTLEHTKRLPRNADKIREIVAFLSATEKKTYK